MTREELKLPTDIPDFTILLYVILRRESSKLSESLIMCDLDKLFAIWSFVFAFQDVAFQKHSF